MSLYNPLGFKPSFYWDETAGLKEDKPMLVKLVQSGNQRKAMPGKSPSGFGFTVGYTVPFNFGSHYALWHVVPAAIELRESHLIFVPASKQSPLKKTLPEAGETEMEQEVETKPEKEKPKPEVSAPLDKSQPSFSVKYLRLPLSGKSQPAMAVGVTFLTEHDNHRLVWNLRPSSEELAAGLLILDQWEGSEEAEAAPASVRSKAHWWQRS